MALINGDIFIISENKNILQILQQCVTISPKPQTADPHTDSEAEETTKPVYETAMTTKHLN